MAKIRDIQRTAAFAWAPDTEPFIATGIQAGAVAADFSDNTQLELWDLDLGGNSQAELSPVASINTNSKCVNLMGSYIYSSPSGFARSIPLTELLP
jgi:protein transport protein SEC31